MTKSLNIFVKKPLDLNNNSNIEFCLRNLIAGATSNALTFNGLTSANTGAYTMRVTDANGCVVTSGAVNFVVNPTPNFGVTHPPIACNGAKTTLTISPLNGAINDFGYSITGGLGYQASNVFVNVAAGNYQIRVVNATTGCSKQVIYNVIQPLKLAATIVKTNVSCNGLTDGKLKASASGGTLPYEFSLNGGAFQTDSVFSNLTAGSYNIQIKDVNGCLITKNGNTLTTPSV